MMAEISESQNKKSITAAETQPNCVLGKLSIFDSLGPACMACFDSVHRDIEM
jgi:hypothetical protein